MFPLSGNLRGILLMVIATASFVINDTFMKFATDVLPPFETLFVRGAFATLWGIPLVLMTGAGRHVGKVADRRVLLRNAVELLAVLGFILGLANVSIADVTVLSQLAPILLMLGAAVFLKLRITAAQLALAGVAFVGAVMVAQPGGSAFSVFALFGIWNAINIAIRDLVGRRIGAEVPGVIVAFSAALVVMIGAGAMMLLFEQFVMPGWRELGLLACSGLFLMGGHYCIFMAYRAGEPGAVAPFFYASAIWAVLSASLVFGTVPNALALAGMALIVISGAAVVAITEAGRRKLRRQGLGPN